MIMKKRLIMDKQHDKLIKDRIAINKERQEHIVEIY